MKPPIRKIGTRRLSDAYHNADRIRSELPHLIQPSNSDLDLILLLEEVQQQEDEIGRLSALINILRQKLEKAHEITRV